MSGVVVPTGQTITFRISKDFFDSSGSFWSNLTEADYVITLPAGFYSSSTSFVSALTQAFRLPQGETSNNPMNGTVVSYSSTTAKLSFTRLVPIFTDSAEIQLRWWFRPISSTSSALSILGLTTAFADPDAFGPPDDTSNFVDTANYLTIVTGTALDYFTTSSSSSSSSESSGSTSSGSDGNTNFINTSSGQEDFSNLSLAFIISAAVFFGMIVVGFSTYFIVKSVVDKKTGGGLPLN